jgi:hypothetical protein
MEQFWFRQDTQGVVFLFNTSVEETDALLKTLPLCQVNLLTFELMPLGPLWPLGMLLGKK